MKMTKHTVYFSLLALLVAGLLCACGSSDSSDLASFPLEEALSNGKPTLAEFGWRECVPCKQMKPILEELAIEYEGKVNMLIVEIPFHEDIAEKYGIMVMPVQIFFDSTGKEVARHAGFLPKAQIIAQLEIMGVQ